MNNLIDTVLSRLQGVKQAGTNQYNACCPAHDDKSPSLRIKITSDRVLLNCHSGCSFNEIVESMGLSPRDLFSNKDEAAVQSKYSRRQIEKILQHEKAVLLLADYEKRNGIESHPDDREREKAARERVRKWEAMLYG